MGEFEGGDCKNPMGDKIYVAGLTFSEKSEGEDRTTFIESAIIFLILLVGKITDRFLPKDINPNFPVRRVKETSSEEKFSDGEKEPEMRGVMRWVYNGFLVFIFLIAVAIIVLFGIYCEMPWLD